MRRVVFRSIPAIPGIPAIPTCALALVLCAPVANAATCTPTGFLRDGINLTAALINPPGKVSDEVDATGCNIGIYYAPGAHGRVDGANIHGANYFGIVNNGANVKIENSAISDIGERPFNGTQHGVAIYFAFGSAAKGKIEHNLIWNYQKGGIVVNGPFATSDIKHNKVIGLGPVNFIAQNGIQVGFGAAADVKHNFVTGNSYTGANFAASGGLLIVGGACYGGNITTDIELAHNTALGNDIGAFLSNLDASCASPGSTPTKNAVKDNVLINNALNNTTGNGPQGYQAGVSDVGIKDKIVGNYICGTGYRPPGNAITVAFAIDASPPFAIDTKIANNTVCPTPPAALSSFSVSRLTSVAPSTNQERLAAPVQ